MALMSGALGDDVLSAGSRREMFTRQTPAGGNAYGLGFELSTDAQGSHFVSHGGAVAGYTAQIVLQLESRTGVVLLRNNDTGRTDMDAAARALLSVLTAAAKESGASSR
jgi:hypothetical protein